MRKLLYIIGLLIAASGCSEASKGVEGTPGEPAGKGAPITLRAYFAPKDFDVTGDVLDSRATMVDLPNEGDFKAYKDPVSLFGFYLQDHTDEGVLANGCFGENRDAVLDSVAQGIISAAHAADLLQESINGVDPSRSYETFLSNSVYVFSTQVNVDNGGAYVSNDVAAFWRPNAYHYFICYAPPMPDANLVQPLVLSLKTEAHGVLGEPDFNFLYGRRVLQYNDAKADTPTDPHPYHKTEGVRIRLMPMLARMTIHLKCDELLKNTAVLFGIRVSTYKQAEFYLRDGHWHFDSPDLYQTITRYFDDEYIVPTDWDESYTKVSLSLFPNIANPGDAIVTGSLNPDDDTPVVVRKLEVCINNTWYEALNLEEHSGDHAGEHVKESDVVPLAPGYRTNIYLSVKPKVEGDIQEWNKLLVTFSNWKQDDVYEYEGTLE